MTHKFYLQIDTQFDYRQGDEMYHVFERGRVNEFGEPYCVSTFMTYQNACDLVREMNVKAEKKDQNETLRLQLASAHEALGAAKALLHKLDVDGNQESIAIGVVLMAIDKALQ